MDGEEIELNLCGEGKRHGKQITIFGEAKTRIYRRELKDFVNTVKSSVLYAFHIINIL